MLAAQQGERARGEEVVRGLVEVAALVEDALVLAADAVNSVVTELTGDSLQQHPVLQTALDKIRTTTAGVVERSGDTINVYGSRFDNIDQAFGPEFEQAIEEAVTSSMGSIFTIIGKAMASGEGTFEQRMEAFGQRMEKCGEQLEHNMQQKASALEQRGEAMCQQVEQLDQLESQIQQRLPVMQDFDLFNTQKTAKN